ncbi:MFS transporter [Nannocystis sp.]|uniref:MFS transporter n=1 Tax=Nannocystis sp. TaxID=1962667 RepID=UPI002421E468|nr:MFS transporter [Nannocystis sp.]MBK7826997.1 MFS transporter [Nannocystis sp.]MBK9755980.1 MFS transporter [Nannocystis sp.]
MTPTRRLKLAYGTGEMAKGVEDAATNLFVLFFFSQVLGLPGWVVGAAMGLALVIDAVTDPLMGSWSDGFHHRWGRRHPFLLASALPVGLSFALLFSPPALGPVGLTLWAAAFLIAHRLALTVFFVPHMALGAELSTDYDERTRIAGIRVFFTYLGAAIFVAVARGVFFKPSAAFPDGQLDPSVYPKLGAVFGVFMVVVVLASTFGTWRAIPGLPRPAAGPDPRGKLGLRRLVAEQREAYHSRGFAVLVVSLLCFFVARGVALSLDLYVGTYFWGLGSDAVALPGVALLGILVGSPLSMLLAGRLDKRDLFVGGMAIYALLTMAPPLLHVLGLFPGGAALKPTLLATLFLSGIVGAAATVAAGSLLADIADEHELATGRRQEGLFFGALSFARKASTGAGTILGGVFLSAIAFPTQAEPGSVDPSLVTAVGLCAGPGTAIFGVAGVWIARRYRADRAAHAAVQAALAARARA